MSDTARFRVLIFGLAAGTFLLRSVPIWLHGRVPLPRWAERLLRHVPAAALTALVIPGSLYLKTEGAYHLAPARIVAAVVALLVALRFRNIAATLVAGMVMLWIAQALLAALG